MSSCVKETAMKLSRRDILAGIGGVSGGMILVGRALAVVEPSRAKRRWVGKLLLPKI